jgi:hypothetical protein
MPPEELEVTTHLSPKTTVPLMWVVGIVMALCSLFGVLMGAYAYLETRFNDQGKRFTGIEKRLISIEATGEDRWSKRDMRTWAAELHAENPTIKVPKTQ